MDLLPSPNTWLQQWHEYETKAENIILNILESSKQEKNTALFEGHVITTLLKNIPDKSLLFSGNSMAIRDFDTFISQSISRGKIIHFYANRGTSGIDGNLSTFLGLLTNHHNYGVIMLGDLSFYHDMNSLLICRELAKKGYHATIVLINNSGGGIFNYLPQHQLDEFDRLWNTDTQLDFQYSAKLYNLHYSKVESIAELETKLPHAMQQSGFQLVEVIIDQKTSVKWHEKINTLS
jgi:2-succinyl-5-enolpyruvyl-6-hydroxy-3-cyclohexene-1-carboxylate synthase